MRANCASEHPVEADSSGLERVDSGLTVRERLNHAALLPLPNRIALQFSDLDA
jgi:hypothetical protein